ncbi:MAG TPA: hypothetical protein VG408_06315 [Actinomycetota bacterium]|nr:hypothetical protein [Actinomycetota bacterium]
MKQPTEILEELSAANPVPETGSQTWAVGETGQRVFAEIASRVEQPEPAARTRRPWRRPWITIPVFVVLTGCALLLATATAGDKIVTVHAADALRDPERVEDFLAAEGIDAEVMAVPADFLAGKWFHLYFAPGADVDEGTFALLKSYVGEIDGSQPSVLERCPLGDCERSGVLEIPGRVRGPITLVVGRPAEPGEEYWARKIDWMNDLAPSGALYCYRLEEKTPPEADRLLRDLGYDVVWVHEVDNYSGETEMPPEGAEITWAFFRGPKTVDMRTTTPEKAEHHRVVEGTPSDQHPRSSAPWAPTCN